MRTVLQMEHTNVKAIDIASLIIVLLYIHVSNIYFCFAGITCGRGQFLEK